jgi:hypothetical protein
MIFDFSVKEVSAKNIFEKLSEADIYKFYLGEEISTGKKYSSPFREDKNPSLTFMVTPGGHLLWRDWGDPLQTKSSGVFSFVMKLFSISYVESLHRINEDFNLGLDGIPLKQAEVKFERNAGIIKVKKYSKIITERRFFSKTDSDFWGQYGISLSTLGKYNVFPVSTVWVQNGDGVKQCFSYKSKSPVYAYKMNSYKGICYKIYAPYEDKFKWLSNCSPNIIQGFEQLDRYGSLLIITKSLKDVMVLYEMGYQAIAPQSETMNLSVEVFRDLKERFDKIILFYDNDETGLRRGKEISEELGIKNIIIPKDEYEIKDISDFVREKGFEEGEMLMDKLINYEH